MKVRIVSLDSKETLELEIPNSCPVGQLKQILSIRLPNAASPDQLSLALSLRSDHLPLESLDGVTPGDAIFCFVNPIPLQSSPQPVNFQNQVAQNPPAVESKRKAFDFKADPTILINVAVQLNAVLLDFGFVAFDPVVRSRLDGFHLPDRFPSTPVLHYTTPRVLSSTSAQSVAIRFQKLGKFVIVYGSLSSNNSIYRLCLDGPGIGEAIKLAWEMGVRGKVLACFWKDVKDHIGLPLLVDLCQSVGLPPPSSSFILLPRDLKLRILEFLRGTDVAKVARVCGDLATICSDNVLWRRKYNREIGRLAKLYNYKFNCVFGRLSGTKRTGWKYRFSFAWQEKKKPSKAPRPPPVPRPYHHRVFR